MSKKMITVQDVADVLDHSLLRPDITVEALKEGCELAKKYQTISVCVRPSDLPIVRPPSSGSRTAPARPRPRSSRPRTPSPRAQWSATLS